MTAGAAAPPRLRPVGDSALLIEFEPAIDVAVNARAIAVAQAVRDLEMPGVRDVVSTYRSVAVYFDALVTDLSALSAAVAGAANAQGRVERGRLFEVPVSYGGEDGPDLESVAAWGSISADDAIERHAAGRYRVFMLGFLPGFAYLGTVDPAIAAPRRQTPRLRVPAGSVAIAGGQTGIYPRVSPGGWQIIGRTKWPLFDPGVVPAATLAPGDTVRFVREGSQRVDLPEGAQGRVVDPLFDQRNTSAVAHVLAPGLMTTVQDCGRWGYQSSGVSVSGPMDAASHQQANALVRNGANAATLEATLTGPELRFEMPTVLAVAGADLAASIDGQALPPGTTASVQPGSLLRFGERRSGTRAYIAFAGGIQVPPVLGSRSTHALTEVGGLRGRPLRRGDRLPLARDVPGTSLNGHARPPVPIVNGFSGGGARVRVLPGPQADWFDVRAFEALHHTRFTISTQSNRMGYRLSGATIPQPRNDMISDATFTGAIQVPPSGEPILLMPDRQTIGGYPQISIVITADLALAGQLAPGDWIEFATCTRGEAIQALAEQSKLTALDA